ncbi:MAG: hypothetical protein NTU61_05990 [Candidatus Altiarchaeota archaeon]|nr:hypothetical protein [Candidatus Altiarchaeota archaeon]
MRLKILNSRERKKLIGELGGRYDAELDSDGLQILQGSREYYVTSDECLRQNLEGLRIDSIGLRLAVETKNGLEPTVNAIQLLYKNPKKTVELDQKQAVEFTKNRETETPNADGDYIATHQKKPIDAATVKQGKLKRKLISQ